MVLFLKDLLGLTTHRSRWEPLEVWKGVWQEQTYILKGLPWLLCGIEWEGTRVETRQLWGDYSHTGREDGGCDQSGGTINGSTFHYLIYFEGRAVRLCWQMGSVVRQIKRNQGFWPMQLVGWGSYAVRQESCERRRCWAGGGGVWNMSIVNHPQDPIE